MTDWDQLEGSAIKAAELAGLTLNEEQTAEIKAMVAQLKSRSDREPSLAAGAVLNIKGPPKLVVEVRMIARDGAAADGAKSILTTFEIKGPPKLSAAESAAAVKAFTTAGDSTDNIIGPPK